MSPGEPHEHVYMATPISVFKNVTFATKKKNKVRPTNHIYSKSVSPGERHKCIYMATPLLVFKNGTFARKKNGAASLKLWHADKT